MDANNRYRLVPARAKVVMESGGPAGILVPVVEPSLVLVISFTLQTCVPTLKGIAMYGSLLRFYNVVLLKLETLAFNFFFNSRKSSVPET